ncbi:MAG TPA: hypothetical protein VFV01_10005 [Spirillospora sp.]|nr:hypothetical protein [Spirillospora sp.]
MTAPATTAPALVPLPEGCYACADCGQACPEGTPFGSRVPVFRGRRAGLDPSMPPPALAGYVLLARCPSCAPRVNLASRLLSGRRDVLHRRGTVARDHLIDALCGLAVVGGANAPTEASDPERLIQEFAAGGMASRWAGRAADHPGECASAPWAHVPGEVRADLRGAAGRLLAERMAAGSPPITLAPPYGGGCSMCGLNGVRLSAGEVARLGGLDAARASVWTTRGGPLCRPCADAVERAGSNGPTAVERAYLSSGYASGPGGVNALRRRIEDGELTVLPWSGSGAAPSSTPWAHMRAEVEQAG